jgi:phosphotransferase system enzyme I (PtsI)
LRGTTVVGGLAIGRVRKSLHDSLGATPMRVPLDALERELNRFHAALSESKEELRSLKEHLRGEVDEQTARILDVHAALLVDSAFLADVENLVMNEQLALEGAIAKVVSDFDRIFKLVLDPSLRERALDLRDVGLRVLRRLRPEREDQGGEGAAEPTILVARELSIVDMFGARNEQVAGIVAEIGTPGSHAAQIARSMRIPTVVALPGLLEAVEEGDLVLLDASEGVLRVRPDAMLVEQYGAMAGSAQREAPRARRSRRAPRTRDGVALEWSAACGSLPEVSEAIESGFDRVGLYRSELVHLVDRDPPGVDAQCAHYSALFELCEHSVVRLLDADSSLRIPWLHDAPESEPRLGLVGVRALLAKEQVLRRQLSALLKSCDAPTRRLSILLPFVVDCGDLRRVKEALFDERRELRRAGLACAGEVELGVVVETPASALCVAELAKEADFLVVSLDSLQELLLAADRSNPACLWLHEAVHPAALRALDMALRAGESAGRPVHVAGASAILPQNLPLLLGLSARRFILPTAAMDEFVEAARRVDLREARKAAQAALRAASAGEIRTIVEAWRHADSGDWDPVKNN